MNCSFVLKILRKYFYHLTGGFQRVFIWIENIPIANFYIVRKIKNDKTTY